MANIYEDIAFNNLGKNIIVVVVLFLFQFFDRG